MKHKAPQVPIKWDKPEPFALVVETTLDGERLAKEKAKQQQDRKESEAKQPTLL